MNPTRPENNVASKTKRTGTNGSDNEESATVVDREVEDDGSGLLENSADSFPTATAQAQQGTRTLMAISASRASGYVPCRDCPHRHDCIPVALPARYANSPLQPVGPHLTIPAGQLLCREGDASGWLYVVKSGALKSVATGGNGRQQIIAIHLPGETLGAEAISTGHRSSTVIALETTELCAIPFARLDRLTRDLPTLQHWFHRAIAREMARSSETAIRLRSVTGQERVAGFLVDLSRRLPSTGKTSTEVMLSVCLSDIALHLGLTRETVSRTFTRLRRTRLIDGTLKCVRLCDMARLSRLAACSAKSPAETRCAWTRRTG